MTGERWTRNSPPEPGDFRHWFGTIVHHADLDPNGHANNTVFSVWFDDGRYQLIVDRLHPVMRPGRYLALATSRIEFWSEVRFGDTPRIGTQLDRIGTSSFAMRQAIFVGERVAAVSETVTVMADGTTRRAATLDPAELRALEELGD